MALEWSTDIAEGGWLEARIRGFGRDVGSAVPHGYDAYVRVFHPITGGPVARWCDLAARNGRIAHPEMQFHLISRPVGETPLGYEPLAGMSVGSLPRTECRVLSEVLVQHTTTPKSCWFAVWEGFGQLQGSPAASVLTIDGAQSHVRGLAPEHVMSGGRVRLPHRAYLLLHGAVTDVVEAFDLLGRQSPNLWWPDDRAWCVATEIDFGWTYVGASTQAISEVVSRPDLETMHAKVTDGMSYDSDRINAQLDPG
jgi:hypothetical protein